MPQDETPAMLGGGANQLIAEAQRLAQLRAPGFGGDKTVRPMLQKQVLRDAGVNHPAETPARLQEGDV